MNIQQIKEKYTCLDYLGDRVVRKTKDGYLCRAPWREDKHPSLTVTANGKGWKDHVTGEHGSLIDMVMKILGTKDLQMVCAEFDKALSPFHQSKTLDGSKEKGKGFAFIDILPLQSIGLYAYLTSRRINTSIARQFLQEAHYGFEVRQDGKFLYALAYRNDKGGYELRSSSYKGSTSPKAITTHWLVDGAPVVVFEGLMDMLSWATLTKGVRHNYVVLNSIVNVQAGVEVLNKYSGTIYLALDNDQGGDQATLTLLQEIPTAIDLRKRFSAYKDVNDYLLNR